MPAYHFILRQVVTGYMVLQPSSPHPYRIGIFLFSVEMKNLIYSCHQSSIAMLKWAVTMCQCYYFILLQEVILCSAHVKECVNTRYFPHFMSDKTSQPQGILTDSITTLVQEPFSKISLHKSPPYASGSKSNMLNPVLPMIFDEVDYMEAFGKLAQEKRKKSQVQPYIIYVRIYACCTNFEISEHTK